MPTTKPVRATAQPNVEPDDDTLPTDRRSAERMASEVARWWAALSAQRKVKLIHQAWRAEKQGQMGTAGSDLTTEDFQTYFRGSI